MLIDINFTEHDFQVLHVETDWRKAQNGTTELYLLIRRYHTRGNGGQLEEARRRLAIEDSSSVIKGVWWINRESANILRIKARRRPYATLYRNGWAGARRTVKSKQN